MKRLFGVVLALNIAFLLWNIFASTAPDPRTRAVQSSARGEHTLLLLSERPTKAPETPSFASEGRVSAADSPAAAASRGPCFALGPFARPEDAVGAVMQLKSRDLEARARKREERSGAGYWAYMPPFNTRAEARAVLKKLHEQKIDSFIVTQGEKSNAISLGIFNDLAQAQARRDELRAKGIEVLVEPRGSTKQEHWVDVEGSSGGNVIAEIEKSLATDFASLRLERQDCR